MSEGVIALKHQILELMAEVQYLRDCMTCFFEGTMPDGASVEQMILASHGKARLEKLRNKPALLQGTLSE